MEKKTSSFNYFPVLIFAILAVALGFEVANYSSPERRDLITGEALIGKELPAFSLQALGSAEKVTKDSVLANNAPVLINIFASWCGSCKVEHHLLMSLAQKNNWPIYGVAWKDNSASLWHYLNSAGNPYQKVALDDKGELVIALGSIGTPETYLVDEHGMIKAVHRGALNEAIIQRKFAPHMQRAAK